MLSVFLEVQVNKKLNWHGICFTSQRSLRLQRGVECCKQTCAVIFLRHLEMFFFVIGVVDLWLHKKNTLTG